MKVFISWSGERSKFVAEALRNWLPKVIQAVEPWMSNEDISAGARWSKNIFDELETTKFGIVCITPENKINPWITFEAGALSKTIEHTFVCPFLFDMKPSQLSGPLVQFQATVSDKSGTKKLINSINSALGNAGLSEYELDEVFDVWWNKLEEKLLITPPFEKEISSRSDKEILEEILDNTREQLRKEDIRLKSIQVEEDGTIKSFSEFKEQMSGFTKLLSNLNSSNSPNGLEEILKKSNIISKMPDFEKIMTNLTLELENKRQITIDLLGEEKKD